MHKAELEALRERVRNATGPDREIDAAIAKLFGWTTIAPPGDYDRPMPRMWMSPNGSVTTALPPHWTGSLDAIVGLIERVLPGASFWLISQNGQLPVGSIRWKPDGLSEIWVGQDCATLPLALCAALLSALIAQEPTP